MEAIKAYLKDIRLIPLLTAEEEIELNKKVKKGSEQARKQMIRSNLRLVISIAKRYMHLGIPLLDLIEEGNLGLMKAVDKFDHEKGFRFSTYAAWWIKQGITRSISEHGKVIRVPVYMNDLIYKWKKTKEKLSQKWNRIPTDKEIAKFLHFSEDKKEQVIFWLSTTTFSLEAPVGEEGENQIMDLLQDETANSPDANIERLFNKERIESLMNMMNGREKRVISMRFGLADDKPQTLASIADALGISRERVRQIEEAAISKIREFLKKKETEV